MGPYEHEFLLEFDGCRHTSKAYTNLYELSTLFIDAFAIQTLWTPAVGVERGLGVARTFVAVGMGVKDDGRSVLGRKLVLRWQSSFGEDKKVGKGSQGDGCCPR